MNNTILVTGGLGFIGFNFLRYIVRGGIYDRSQIIVIDKVSEQSCDDALLYCKENSITVIQHDLADISYNGLTLLKNVFKQHYIQTIIHFAAESHVDRSITDPHIFVNSNVVGTNNLLHAANIDGRCSDFIYISTDEVYGSLSFESRSSEITDILEPRSPYAASKAAGELIALAYKHTYNLPVKITRCCNNFGWWQNDEKFIPTIFRCIFNNKPIPVYGTGNNIREWIHADDHIRLIFRVLNDSHGGPIYNIGAGYEMSNLDLIHRIGKVCKDIYDIDTTYEFVEDRKGHDLRYSLECNLPINEINFKCINNHEVIKNLAEFYKEKYEGKDTRHFWYT